MDTLLHCSLQDHTPAHSEGCQWCNDTDLGCSSRMEHHQQPKQLAWGMRRVPQQDTMPLTHLQVAKPHCKGEMSLCSLEDATS